MGYLSQTVTDNTQPLFAAVRRLLRPLVRLLLDRGVSFDQFANIAKGVFVEVADVDYALPGRKQTVSRISVLTGLTRKEVVRLREESAPEDAESAASYNRASRVVTGWLMDHPMEGTSSGAAPLPLEGAGSFAEVVRRHSGDMPVRAVLDELLRVGAVRLRGDEVELIYRHYIPPLGDTRRLVYLGEDVADLITTIGHNLNAPAGQTRLQRKVFYDNVPAESLPALRAMARQKGERVIDELVREMSPHDRDVNSGLGGTERHRVVVGIYFAEEPFVPQDVPSPELVNPPATPAATLPAKGKTPAFRGRVQGRKSTEE
jgi:hypothetical protein